MGEARHLCGAFLIAAAYATIRTTSAGGQCLDEVLCLPGIDAMGVGFDIVSGSSAGLLPVVQFSYAAGDIYSNPFNRTLQYAVPVEAKVTTKTSSDSEVTQASYSDAAEYAQGLAASVSVSGSAISGAFSASAGVSEVKQLLDQTDAYGSYTVRGEQLSIYEVALNPIPFLNVTDAFRAFVETLPPTYDPNNSTSVAAYDKLLSYYGTHITTAATFGGSADMNIAVASSYTSNHTSADVTAQAKLHMDFIKAGGSANSSTTDADSAFLSNSLVFTSLSGGDPTDLTMWSAWRKTYFNAPSQIQYKVHPISEIVKFFSDARFQDIANNIDAAIANKANASLSACQAETGAIENYTQAVHCLSQTLTHCYVWCDGITLDYDPDGWMVDESLEFGVFLTKPGNLIGRSKNKDRDICGQANSICRPINSNGKCDLSVGDLTDHGAPYTISPRAEYEIQGIDMISYRNCLQNVSKDSKQPKASLSEPLPKMVSRPTLSAKQRRLEPTSAGTCGSGTTAQCLPGYDVMGAGFDIVTGTSTQLLSVVKFTYGLNKTYHNPFNSALKYSVPDQATVVDQTHGQSTTESKVFFFNHRVCT